MVHYSAHRIPAAGQRDHRLPPRADFQYINELNVGGTITIENRACQTFVYKVTQRWDLSPAKVTQLAPTSGHELTMITCDPWWQDYNRLVWRAELISSPAPSSPGTTAGRWPTPPSDLRGNALVRVAFERTRVRLFGPRLEPLALEPDEDDRGQDCRDREGDERDADRSAEVR